VTPAAQFWLLILVLAVGTWAMRSMPIMLHGHVPHPPWLERLLRHVPVAALTALVVPGALYVKDATGTSDFAPARTAAAIVALMVAFKTKNVLATLLAGMLILWVGQAILNAL
jgi:branched-subunit amino acid transport protein